MFKTKKTCFGQKFLLLIAVVFVCATATTMSQKYSPSHVDYDNVPVWQRADRETLLLNTIFGEETFKTIRANSFSSCMNQLPYEPSDSCHRDSINQWDAWRFGVYEFKDIRYDCKVRIEYMWRNCLCDHNLTQHHILGVIYKTCPLPDWLCFLYPNGKKCTALDDWLNVEGADRQEHYLAFYEDMYNKLAIRTFLNNSANDRILEGDSINRPMKAHHISGACESTCTTSVTYGQEVYTIITQAPCNKFNCCVKTITTCRDSVTHDVKTKLDFSSYTIAQQEECAALDIPEELVCQGETTFRFGCGVVCDGIDRQYNYCRDFSYPLAVVHNVETYMAIHGLYDKQSQDIENQAAVFSLRPNPASDYITADFAAGSFTALEVVDNSGRSLLTMDISGSDTEAKISLTSLSSGTYFILMTDSNNIVHIKQFIKE